MATRRGVLAGLLAAAVPRLTWAEAGNPAFVAAAQDPAGDHWLHGLSASGDSLFHLPLPGRGHAAAAHPYRPEVVAFARRPGHFAFVIDCAFGQTVARLSPPEGRQFNGHGVFSADGRILFTSEVVGETSEGRLGLWDSARGFARLGDVPTHGIGPHDVKRLEDGTLVIANGGIRTDPQDRTKLNIDSMEPSLVYLSPDGDLLEQVTLEPGLAQNSIRHLALGPGGVVAFAMQWEGDPAEPVPLLGLHRRGAPARLCPPPEGDSLAMRGYAGSIAFDGARNRIALTSPKGGIVMVFDGDGAHRATWRRQDACGVAVGEGGFVVTDGLGAISACDEDGLHLLTRGDVAWDNHLIRIGQA
jgi:hypothetical protein